MYSIVKTYTYIFVRLWDSVCVCLYAIDNNYSKVPIIKTTQDLKSLLYFEAFLADICSAIVMAILGTLRMFPLTAQFTLHL